VFRVSRRYIWTEEGGRELLLCELATRRPCGVSQKVGGGGTHTRLDFGEEVISRGLQGDSYCSWIPEEGWSSSGGFTSQGSKATVSRQPVRLYTLERTMIV